MRLFERVRQRMHRTPEATLLYEEIRRLNVGLESLGRKIRAIRGSAQPRLRVGCIHAYSGAIVSDTIARFRVRYPDTPLYLQIRDSNTLRDMVVSGELDLAAVADESELEGLRGHRLASLQAVAVFQGPYADPAGTGRIRAAGRCRCDRVERGGRVRKRLDALLRQSGQALRISIETPYSSTVCQLALAGHGVGIANPATAVGMEAAGLAFRPLAAPVHFECHMILTAAGRCRRPANSGDLPARRAGARRSATASRLAARPAVRGRAVANTCARHRARAAGLSRAGRLRSGSARPTTRRRACPSVAAA